MTTQDGSSKYRNPGGVPLLREVPVGTKLLLKDDSIVEIIGNPGDGGWVQVRYLESPNETAEPGDEEFVFVADVKDFAQEI